MKPFFPYFGSAFAKSAHYPAPLYDTVWEVFAGSAGYSTYHDVPHAHLIDADPVIVAVWDYLLRVKSAEILSLPDLPNAGDCVDDENIPQEAKWLIGFWLNRGSATPKKRRTAYSARSDKGQMNWGPRAKTRIAEQLSGIAGWTVRLGDYADAPAGLETTTFVDPPYEDKGRYYRVKFDRHAELGAWCRARHGQVIVCEGAGATWLPFSSLGRFKTSLGHADELVWLSASQERAAA